MDTGDITCTSKRLITHSINVTLYNAIAYARPLLVALEVLPSMPTSRFKVTDVGTSLARLRNLICIHTFIDYIHI